MVQRAAIRFRCSGLWLSGGLSLIASEDRDLLDRLCIQLRLYLRTARRAHGLCLNFKATSKKGREIPDNRRTQDSGPPAFSATAQGFHKQVLEFAAVLKAQRLHKCH